VATQVELPQSLELAAELGRILRFIADYLPYASGDGMEHRNSTILTGDATLKDDRMQLLETASHEYFHAWNVERIRPVGLEPFDFDRANMTDSGWAKDSRSTTDRWSCAARRSPISRGRSPRWLAWSAASP
jgi:predicted metalloprotease with PDZ domain